MSLCGSRDWNILVACVHHLIIFLGRLCHAKYFLYGRTYTRRYFDYF